MAYLRAFSTLGCPQATLEDTLTLAGDYGLDALELRGLGDTLDLPAYLAATYGSPEALSEYLEKRVKSSFLPKIVALGTSLHLIGSTAQEREAFLEYVPWAEALGVPWLRVFDGGSQASETEVIEAGTTLTWWQQERERRKATTEIMIETHDAFITGERLHRLFERAPQVAILWDSHHTWRKGGEDPLVTWSQVHSRVVHVHVKDSVSVPSGRLPFTYVLPGTGEFPIEPMRTELAREFKGTVSLEWERQWHPSLPPLEEALISAKHHAWW
ncbi:MAG TPA: TIM barrel protein [Opitutaceae bacterium]|nr:TIM barrel protein [Opitutaceae bacterium]